MISILTIRQFSSIFVLFIIYCTVQVELSLNFRCFIYLEKADSTMRPSFYFYGKYKPLGRICMTPGAVYSWNVTSFSRRCIIRILKIGPRGDSQKLRKPALHTFSHEIWVLFFVPVFAYFWTSN